jgi:4-amino-4-deoxy-L-arabinose transferase-like glycosyltransferase
MTDPGISTPSTHPFARRSLTHQIVLIAVAAIVFFTNLGGMRLMDRDEPRNAGCAAEMLARHDWVVPMFNAEIRTHKPVLTYWFMMSAYSVFGVNEFGARFWSAVLGIGTVLMTYHIGRRLFNASVGFWGGIVTCTSLWFAVASRIATPDSVFVFFSTLPIFIYVLAAFRPKDSPDPDAVEETRWREEASPFPRAWWIGALVYAAMGFAVLAKGPVGLVLPTGVLGMFLLIVRRANAPGSGSELPPATGFASRTSRALSVFEPLHIVRAAWSMRPLAAIVIALAISLPWYLMVHQRTNGEWTRGFFLEHNLGRATNAMEGHGGSGLTYFLYLFYYPVVTLIAFSPWSVFLIESFIEASRRLARPDPRRDPWRLGYILTICWVGVYIVAFTIASTKLPSYVTPMYPALGLLVGAYLYQLCTNRSLTGAKRASLIYGFFLLLGVACAIALPLVARTLLPGSEWLGVLGIIPIAAGAVGLILNIRNQHRKAVRVFALGAIVLTTTILGGVLFYVDEKYQKSDVLIEAIHRSHDHPTIGTYGVLEPSWVFYARQPITEHHDDTDGAIESLKNPAAYLITSMDDYEFLAPDLPPGVGVIARVPRYLRPDRPDLVAVGRLIRAGSR